MTRETVVGRTREAAGAHLLCTGTASHFNSLNDEWERLLGWTREELMSRPFTDFVHPNDRQRSLQEAAKVTQPGYEVVAFENRFRARGGGWRWLRWTARADGTTWTAVADDVTAERLADPGTRTARAPIAAPRPNLLPGASAPSAEAGFADVLRSAPGVILPARISYALIVVVMLLAGAGLISATDVGSSNENSTHFKIATPAGMTGTINAAGPLRTLGRGESAPPTVLGPRIDIAGPSGP